MGKTTLLIDALSTFARRAGGFYTQEVRQGPRRVGFDLVTLDGERVPLARVGGRGPYRVGRYEVDVAALEGVGVAALHRARRGADLVVVDEIGRMELFSPAFREVVWRLLGEGKPLLGTVTVARHPEADRVKGHPGVAVATVTLENRDRLRGWVQEWLRHAVPA